MTVANPICNFDIKDNKSFATKPSTNFLNLVLSANTPVNIARADLAYTNGNKPNVLVFSADGPFWVKWRGTNAAVPSTNVLDGTGVELSPAVRKIDDVTQFSVVAPATTKMSIALYYY